MKGQRAAACLTLNTEQRGHESRNVGSHWKLEKARKQILPLELPEEYSSTGILSLAQ